MGNHLLLRASMVVPGISQRASLVKPLSLVNALGASQDGTQRKSSLMEYPCLAKDRNSVTSPQSSSSSMGRNSVSIEAEGASQAGTSSSCCDHENDHHKSEAAEEEDEKIKRTICKFWLEGKCDRGDKCSFAHGETEIGKKITEESRQQVTCRFWLQGKCKKGDGCKWAHKLTGAAAEAVAAGILSPPTPPSSVDIAAIRCQ